MNILSFFVTVLSLIVIAGLLFSLPVLLLWNWLMPDLFGLSKIDWFQAWGLVVLSGFLFKSNVEKK